MFLDILLPIYQVCTPPAPLPQGEGSGVRGFPEEKAGGEGGPVQGTELPSFRALSIPRPLKENNKGR